MKERYSGSSATESIDSRGTHLSMNGRMGSSRWRVVGRG